MTTSLTGVEFNCKTDCKAPIYPAPHFMSINRELKADLTLWGYCIVLYCI